MLEFYIAFCIRVCVYKDTDIAVWASVFFHSSRLTDTLKGNLVVCNCTKLVLCVCVYACAVRVNICNHLCITGKSYRW